MAKKNTLPKNDDGPIYISLNDYEATYGPPLEFSDLDEDLAKEFSGPNDTKNTADNDF